jgi:uncharacterized membrane protein YdjX (TVP38/TMEM64 family)
MVLNMKRKRLAKLFAVVLWGAILIAFISYKARHDLGTLDILGQIYTYATGTRYGPLVYILVYAFRPITFFPAMWLTILSGGLFGFWGGVLYTIIGENLSANLAYVMGRYFAQGAVSEERLGPIYKWKKKLDERSFIAVLIMRLIYLPFDLVNFSCGIFQVRWLQYAFATFVGILPGLITFVSFGASVNFDEFLQNADKFDPGALFNKEQILISATLFLASMLLAKFVYRRQQDRNKLAT